MLQSLLLIALLTACEDGKTVNALAGLAVDDELQAVDYPANKKGAYAGSDTCQSCHAEQYRAWQLSHHAKALAKPTETSVLGDFDNRHLQYAHGETRFSKNTENGESGFYIDTPLLDSAAAEGRHRYKVQLVLGHYPLQQYVLETAPGRLQVYELAWDARGVEQGGQRWFHLVSEPIGSSDHPFYWQNYLQNWNSQCADCHSTGFEAGYLAKQNTGGETSGAMVDGDTWHSRWREMAVGCESCHGPTAGHVADYASSSERKKQSDTIAAYGEPFAQAAGSALSLAKAPDFQFSPHAPIAAASETAVAQVQQMNVCGRCHSLRQPLRTGDGADIVNAAHYLDVFELTPVQEPLYYADGQIREEVFVAGSFLQSKMHAAGVTCTHCHDAHSGRVEGFDDTLPATLSNDQSCLQCHRAATYAVAAHHHHPVSSEAARCVSCHMPETTYMGVDPRRDHRFLVPDPYAAQQLSTPDVCTDCHSDRSLAWAISALAGWRDQPRRVTLAEDVSAAESGSAKALVRLFEAMQSPSTPVMQRAMVIDRIPLRSQPVFSALVALLNDEDALVRRAAIERLADLEPATRVPLLGSMLDDEVKAVRFAATLALADVQSNDKYFTDNKMDVRLHEYQAHYRQSADSLGARLQLARLYTALGQVDKAIDEYRQVLTWVPVHTVSLLNLADLYRQQQRDDLAEPLLQRAVKEAATQAAPHYALALLQVRGKRYQAATQQLQRAMELAPTNAAYLRAYLLLLDAMGRRDEALALLQASPLLVGSPQLQQLSEAWRRSGDRASR